MKKILFLLSFLLAFLISSVEAQESILLLRNGKKVTIADYKLDATNYYEGKISYTTLKGKQKKKYLEEVFSVLDSKGVEKVLYEPNDALGEILLPEQMKEYTIGMGDAMNLKLSPLVMIGGVTAGIGGAIIPKPEVTLGNSSTDIPVGILVPTAYVALMGATTPNAENLQTKLPEKASNEYYLMGYQEGLQKKRIKHSIIGAAVGFVGGFVIFSSIN